MKNQRRQARVSRPVSVAALSLLLLTAGCASVQPWADAPPSPAADEAAEARQVEETRRMTIPGRERLAQGIERYEAGDFVGAIRTLHAPEIERADTATRVEAGKYLAFVYCVTERHALCRQAFDHVLSIDPLFRLAPAEAGHPLWGPVFMQAREAAGSRTR